MCPKHCAHYNAISSPLSQEAEKKLEVSAGALHWHQTQASSIESKYLVLENEISQHCRWNQKENSQHKQTTHEILSLNKKFKSENRSHCQFLMEMLRVLSSDVAADEFDWALLSAQVKTCIQTMLNSLSQCREEIKCCKMVMERQNCLLESAAQIHESGLVQQELEEEQREKQWQQRLTELKRSYESILMEGVNGGITLNLQSRCNDSMQELEQLDRLKCRLELSNAHLTTHLAHAKDVQKSYKNDRACLLSCVCLITGSLFACHQQIQQLRHEKQLLVQISRSSDTWHGYVHSHAPVRETQASQRPCNRGILYFKIVTIVVMAVNRLKRLRSESLRLSLSSCLECGNHLGVLPFIGLKASKSKPLTNTDCAVSNRDVARWLRSKQVLLDARKCFSALQSSLDAFTVQHHSGCKDTGHTSTSTQSKSTPQGELDEDLGSLVMACHHNFVGKISCHFQF